MLNTTAYWQTLDPCFTSHWNNFNRHPIFPLPDSSKYVRRATPQISPRICNKLRRESTRVFRSSAAHCSPWWTRQIRSEIQKLDRTISIYTPPGYQPDGLPNRLLVLFDAEDYLDPATAMPITMDNLRWLPGFRQQWPCWCPT